MIIIYIIIILIILYLNSRNIKEKFNNNKNEKYVKYNDDYKSKIIKFGVGKNQMIDFYGDVNTYLKDDKYIDQKTSCEPKMKNKIMDDALKFAFEKTPEREIKKYDKIANYCNQKAIKICEMTDPRLYISENKYFQPRWIFKPYQNVELPKNTNLKCWENIYNCCKRISK